MNKIISRFLEVFIVVIVAGVIARMTIFKPSPPMPSPPQVVAVKAAPAAKLKARPQPFIVPAPVIEEKAQPAETTPVAPPTPPVEVSEPIGRDALARVGVDADAEAVWIQAINNAALPASDRQNLIEDLNEDGFPDFRNITVNDLPLIENRLKLVENLSPMAMDDVNTAAFQEAYKDLKNMYRRVTGTDW